MALFAAEMASYLYDEDQDPAGAFEWCASPCGRVDLVSEGFRRVFDIINGSPRRSNEYKNPKNLERGSGKKGDSGNPRSPTSTRSTNTATPTPVSYTHLTLPTICSV